jgi:hypothetical protein
VLRIRITFDADTCLVFHFDADPDPTFHFDADPDPDPTFQFDPDLDPTTHFSLDLYPLMLQNDPLRIPPFQFDSDPDPTFTDADPDQDPASKIMGIRNTGVLVAKLKFQYVPHPGTCKR